MLASAAEGIGGQLAEAVQGDVLLENDRLRVVIQKPGRSIALNPHGGNLIDADLARDGGPGRDDFGEQGLFFNGPATTNATSVEIVADGSDGRAAVVRAKGPAARSDYINPVAGARSVLGMDLPFDTERAYPLHFEVTYRLGPLRVRSGRRVRRGGLRGAIERRSGHGRGHLYLACACARGDSILRLVQLELQISLRRLLR